MTRATLLLLAALAARGQDAVSLHAAKDFPLTANPAASVWRMEPSAVFEHGRYGEAVPAHRTEVRSRWTPANLYFLFTCRYEEMNPKPGPPAAGETNGLWDWDVAEVFIGSDFENFRRYKEFEVSPRGEWVDLSIEVDPNGRDLHGDWLWNSGFEKKTRIDEAHKTWYVEMRIPMQSIAAWQGAPGRAFRVNFYRCQGKRTHYLAWRPVNQESFHKPEAFGKLVLQR